MTRRQTIYVALGSNLGDREKFLSKARQLIAALPDTRLVGETAVEETEPIGPVKQPPFLNQMIVVETTLTAESFLHHLQRIEEGAGRVRGERWGPRTLDLDIVALDGHPIATADLVVPHPELPNREFWLRQLELLRQTHVAAP